MGTNEGETLLTVQEAAAKAGVGETAIRNALLRGRLPFELKYGRKLIKDSDLAAYQAEVASVRPSRRKHTDAAGDEKPSA